MIRNYSIYRLYENENKYRDVINNPDFKKWFGNSKMVDKNGKPLICFHGTNSEFDVFDLKYKSHDDGYYGRGFYFTFGNDKYSREEAISYGRNLLEVYLKIENPFDFSSLFDYKGKNINLYGLINMVFLYNVAQQFPEIAEQVSIDDYHNISVLPTLVDKYLKTLKIIEFEDNCGEKIKSGYVKSEVIEYDNTDNGGEKGSYVDYDELGRYVYNVSDEELEIGLIFDAIEKYDDIAAKFHAEGYMTRNPIITSAIKNRGYDGILQSMEGDEAVVFNPNQIKSATKNNGNFSLDSNNIYENENNFDNIVNNSNFWKWFGSSKVVDDNGNPLVVYHGSKYDFNEFDVDKIKSSRIPGFYFTKNIQLAQNYNKNGKLYTVYLSIQNPLNSDETKKIDISKNDLEKIFKEIGINEDVEKFYNRADSDIDIVEDLIRISNIKTVLKAINKITGKDGIITRDRGLGKSYIVFNPNQIKSVENNGNFSLDSNNIYESYEFSYNCVNPTDMEELSYIIDNMKEISRDTFYKHVDVKEVYDIFANNYNNKKALLNDYYIRYYKINKNDIDAYVMVHSGIEYVFKNTMDKIKKDRIRYKKYDYNDEWTTLEDYRLLNSYNGIKIGDYIKDLNRYVKNIYQYKNTMKVQFELNDGRFYDSKLITK